MNFQERADFDAHEEVRIFNFAEVGGQAIIAIHSTHLGPAAGGCRVWRYAECDDGLIDALRLSRGMSYKNALADLPLGGGKSVIIPPSGHFDRRALFEAFGRAVESFGGRYITAEDVGSSVSDMQMVRSRTNHVGGLPAAEGQAGGDPSPWTALGVFLSIQAAYNWRNGCSLDGAKVTVQGVGAVGVHLGRLLSDAGALVSVADINEDRAVMLAELIGAQVVSARDAHKIAADVFAPCALGACLNAETITDLAAPIICGAANNQLATVEIGAALKRLGKVYCPDYVVNAGGIIAVHSESIGNQVAQVSQKVAAIPDRLVGLLSTAEGIGESPEAVADRLAISRIGRTITEMPDTPSMRQPSLLDVDRIG